MSPTEASMTVRNVTIGLDLGTSGLKVVALDETGQVIARAAREYGTARPVPGAAEQSPTDWMTAILTTLDDVAATVPPSQWMAMGLSAMLPTLVLLDGRYSPIGPAITWQDTRADAHGNEMRDTYGREALYLRTGQIVDGRYLLPMASRAIAELAADEAASVAWIAAAKDYAFHILTGELLTDPSTATGFGSYDLRAGEWAGNIAAHLTERALLPEVVRSTEHRPLRRALSSRWGCDAALPVVVGAADSVLGAYGLGVRTSDQVAYIAGTSTVILGVTDHLMTDPLQRCLVTPLVHTAYGLEMDILATGSAISWFSDVLGFDGGPTELVATAALVAPLAAPTVLPYFAPGEQGALWDESLRGVISGLTLHTTRADIARGLITGILLESRRCVAVLDDLVPGNREILASGSGATSLTFLRDLSDASGRPVSYDTEAQDHSAIGAALLAATAGAGWQLGPPGRFRTIEPDRAKASEWADLAAVHDSLRIASRHI